MKFWLKTINLIFVVFSLVFVFVSFLLLIVFLNRTRVNIIETKIGESADFVNFDIYDFKLFSLLDYNSTSRSGFFVVSQDIIDEFNSWRSALITVKEAPLGDKISIRDANGHMILQGFNFILSKVDPITNEISAQLTRNKSVINNFNWEPLDKYYLIELNNIKSNLYSLPMSETNEDVLLRINAAIYYYENRIKMLSNKKNKFDQDKADRVKLFLEASGP